MVSFAKPLSYFFLIVLGLIFSSFQIIQARESVFFSKVTHYNTNIDNENVKEPDISIAQVPASAPAPAPALLVAVEPPEVAPVPASSYSERGYGGSNDALYSLGSSTSPSTKETPTTLGVEDEIFLAEELGGESFDQTGNHQSTNVYNNGNINGYFNKDKGSITSSYNNVDNYNDNGNTNTKNYNANYSNNLEVNEQKGLSDTRFMENGSYYHDLKNGINNNYADNYESGRGNTGNNFDSYYGNYSEDANEFNTMEEYDKYQETQGYVP